MLVALAGLYSTCWSRRGCYDASRTSLSYCVNTPLTLRYMGSACYAYALLYTPCNPHACACLVVVLPRASSCVCVSTRPTVHTVRVHVSFVVVILGRLPHARSARSAPHRGSRQRVATSDRGGASWLPDREARHVRLPVSFFERHHPSDRRSYHIGPLHRTEPLGAPGSSSQK